MSPVESEDEHAGDAAAAASPLAATLSSPLPALLVIGGGTALHLEGRCDPAVDPASLEVWLGPLRTPVDSARMPGPEPGEAADRWSALLELPRGSASGELALRLRASRDGQQLATELGRLRVVDRDLTSVPTPPSVVTGGGGPLVAVCMATHEPQIEPLRRQLDSIRAQDWPSWVCLISDDASSPGRFAELQELIAGDERFVASRSDTRLGFYRNFERALRMLPAEAAFVALSDQDDVWDPDKLTALHEHLAARPEAELAYSDMRIVDGEGREISDTYWILRRNRWDDITSLLVANTVTGAASLFRRELLDDAVPFPPPVADPYHDHWLALCALARAELAYLDRPTYDRVRHLGSVTDETRHAQVLRAMAQPDASPDDTGDASEQRPEPAPPGRDPAAVYRQSYRQLAQFARVAEMRIGERMRSDRRRALRRFSRGERSLLTPLWLALRSLRPLFGRNETLGRERALAAALLWRRAATRRARRRA